MKYLSLFRLHYRVLVFSYALLPFLLPAQTTDGHGIIPAPASMTTGYNNSEITSFIFPVSSLISPFIIESAEDIPGIVFNEDTKSNVTLRIDKNLEDESYHINIKNNKTDISAGSERSIQYALVSLLQMIQFHGFPLPQVNIQDRPAFRYRGMHLDVSRHFFTVREIKKFLDYLAFYKYNHFHWHLTDDQGWRIEIRKYPKLQELAAFRNETLVGHYSDQPHVFDGKRYGGYYTREEIREIVEYAGQRHINVVPEIEMPGHALAALTAYPELGCTGGPYQVATKWGVFDDVFCPSETTFAFLEGVIDEVTELFPYEYIHIGGDECPKTTWEKSALCQEVMKENGLKDAYELQSYFIKRMERYINAKGRKIIGWDEILEGGLAPGATVMSWRGIQGGLEAARLGQDVIMTPGSHCYFDYYQSTSPGEPVAIGGYTPMEKVYHWNPVPRDLQDTFRHHILGGQANVWTEYIPNFSHVEYMAYARGLAMSEALWTTPRDYREFVTRFLKHQTYWKQKGVNMANHVFELNPVVKAGHGKPVTISFDLPEKKQVWHEWNTKSEKGNTFILAEKGPHQFSVDGDPGLSRPYTVQFNPHLATNAKLSMNPLPSDKYSGNGPGSIVNGILGEDSKYGGKEWLGFEGKNVDILLEWKAAVNTRQISFRFFKGEGQWIYLPRSVEIFASQDGKLFESVKKTENITADRRVGNVSIPAVLKDIRFIKISVQNYGKIPDGAQGAGHGAWLFMDEIVVE